jgi:hypothetical protein
VNVAHSIGIRALADELNVSPQMIKDFVHAGHLETVNGRVSKDSADNLRWHLALARTDTSEGVNGEQQGLLS